MVPHRVSRTSLVICRAIISVVPIRDIGVMDSEGYISINGRLKEMIIRGGENIYPREIEDFLLKHNDIVDIQVLTDPMITEIIVTTV